MSRKRAKSDLGCADEVSADDGVEKLDSGVGLPASGSKPSLSYAAMLRNRSGQPMMDDEDDFSEADCCYSQGKHGLNLTFSERVDAALDRPWRFSVIVKLMGKPNSVNSFDFILRGLRRKWKSHGGWKLVDLVNNYFIVNFELEHDMEQALCGGPWILAGQTLVVRRWTASFNPLTDKVDSMAVWARVIGLPVKYYNDFAMRKIGKLLGEVVKIDEVTLKQDRGKYGRVCVEIDLGKPFRPTVEINGVEYGVQYEGLSLICFSCGVYGHAKDKCVANVDSVQIGDGVTGREFGSVKPKSGDPSLGSVPGKDVTMVEKEVPEVEAGYGPWMLMDYKNKRRSGNSGVVRKAVVQGSRFASLQVDDDALPQEDVPKSGADPQCSAELNPPLKSKPVAEIIQMWSCLQSKLKDKAVLGPGVVLDTASDGCDISSNSEQSSPVLSRTTDAVRFPLVDLSNSAMSSGKKGSKNMRKSLDSAIRSKALGANGKNLFPGAADLSKVNFAGFYGRAPPDEGMMDGSLPCLSVVPLADPSQVTGASAECDNVADNPSSVEGVSMDC